MATITHAFTNPKSDGGDATVTKPSDWNAAHLTDIPLDNFTATTDPTVNDDAADGYGVGSRWINTSLGLEWHCIVATTGAAIWHPIINPVPSCSGFATTFSASTSSLAITTSAFVVNSNLIAYVCSSTRKSTGITQTNVTWTERFTGNGGSQFVTIYTGVVAGGAAGTTATVAFGSAGSVVAEIFKVDDSVLPNFTTASLNSSNTATSTLAINNTSIVLGAYYLWIVCAAAPASSYSGGNIPWRHLATATGGQGRAGFFRAMGASFFLWSLQSSSTAWYFALVRLT